MAGVLLRYRNLYSTIQIMDTEHYKLGEVGYKIGVEPLNDNQKVLAYIEVLKEHSEIKLSVFETMDSIKKELLEFCETEFNKYYKEVDDFFPADEADEDE